MGGGVGYAAEILLIASSDEGVCVISASDKQVTNSMCQDSYEERCL